MNDKYSDLPDFIRTGSQDFLLQFIRLTGADQLPCAVISSDLRILACTPKASAILGRNTFQSLSDILSQEACHSANACLENQSTMQLKEMIDGIPYLITFSPVENSLFLLLRPATQVSNIVTSQTFYQREIEQDLANIHHAGQCIASDPEISSSVRKYTKIIQKNILRIIRAQNHTKILSPSFTANDLQLTLEDLADLVREIGETVRSSLIESERKITLQIPQNLLCIFDREYLSIALYNLLINSIRYTQGDLKLTLRESGFNAIIQVSDQGSGIDETIMQQILQSACPNDFPLSSTGYGIALAQKIAVLHKGNLLLGKTNYGFSAALRLPLALPERGKLRQTPTGYVTSLYNPVDIEFFSLL